MIPITNGLNAGSAWLGVILLTLSPAPLAAAGLALINNALGRSRSAAHAMLSALCAVSVAWLVFVIIGFAWAGVAGGPAHVATLGGKPWNWLAAAPVLLRRQPLDLGNSSLLLLLQLSALTVCSIIPLSAGADRWRLGAVCASTALLAGVTFPIFAHWAWDGGWLAQLGVNFGLGSGFLDSGAGTIHVVGGLTALSLAWILGPRQDKFSSHGIPTAIPGHNLVQGVFGCFVAWVGWLGLSSAASVLVSGARVGDLVQIVLATTLSAAASALMAVVLTRVRFRRPDASLSANGWVGGLVASSAAPAFLSPAAAILVGAIAGVLVIFTADWLEMYLSIDDPGGAVAVHAVAGIWGLLAAGIAASAPGAGSGQLLAQLVGIATLLGFVLPLTYGLNWLLNRIVPQRVDAGGERQGLDLHELGAGAYPDFVTHADEFNQR